MIKLNTFHQSRINRVIDFINGHLDQPISLETLAKVGTYSPFHFHRVFVAVTGETVNQFTNRMKNEKAARLLRFSRKSISDISIECGFSSPATLSRSFKQYFEVSPSSYRNGAVIKNSKICKEPLPASEYYCTVNSNVNFKEFPVEIRQVPERRIAYIRVSDAFRKGVVIGAFSELVEWAKTNNLFQTETIFGMSIDDPDVTPKEKYRYEACITIPDTLTIEPDSLIQSTSLPACKYAVTAVKGNLDLVGQAFNYLFDKWLISSDYECEHYPGVEVFLEKENVCNWNEFNLEIMIPVKRITT